MESDTGKTLHMKYQYWLLFEIFVMKWRNMGCKLEIFSIKMQSISCQRCTNIDKYKCFNIGTIFYCDIANIVVKMTVVFLQVFR